MPNILIWVVLTFFLLITPKTALAAWNGLSTAGPDFLSSSDGKTWTYEIGNDGTVYTGGESVNLAFGAYWCGKNGAAPCDGTNSDYTKVSTLQNFTISAPAAGNATAPATKTFAISRADYPCGRVQVDLVPDPNPNGNIIGGHIYDTGKICPPGPPADLLATCSSGTGTFSWRSDSSVDAQDDLRIDYNPPSWNGSCSNPTDPGKDLCFGPPASPGNVTGMASGTYDWWVDSCNASGCSSKHGSNFTCTAPPSAPTNLSASCPAPGTTATVSWTNGSGATSHNVRIDNTVNTWSNNCSSLNTGDFCFDNASSPKSFSSTDGATYSWWVDACNSAGCTTASGSNFTCASGGFIQLDVLPCTARDTSGNIITTANPGQTVTWREDIIGGTANFTYTWSGTDSLSGTTSSSSSRTNTTNKTYTTAGSKTATVEVTDSSSPIQTKSATCSVTINAFAYSLTNEGNKSVTQGSSVSNVVTVKKTSGTTQSVTLTPPANANGITYSLSSTSCTPNAGTNSDTCTSTLTMAASSTATTGTSSVTVTGKSTGVTDQTTTFQLTVSAPATQPPGSFSQNSPTAGCSGSSPYVDLSWNTSTNAQSYEVKRNTTLITSGLSQLTYRDSGVAASSSYSYLITARNNVGTIDSDSGTAKSVTTTSCTSPPVCPDGVCNGTETNATCPQDCPVSSSSCAWIQTTGGDVHSNTRINITCRL